MARFNLILKGGTVVNQDGIGIADIGIEAGRITAIGSLDVGVAAKSVDLTGLHVLPGVIDTQVHFREPGLEHKEDLNTGTAAAAMGGVVAVFEMPNTKPSTSTAEALTEKLIRAKGRTYVDHAFFIGATGANSHELPHLERLPGCAGVKLFMGASTGDLLVDDDQRLEEVLRHGTRRMAVHAEDEARMRERRSIAETGGGPELHPIWRDDESAIRATQRLLALVRRTGRRVHVLHVTTAEEMALLAQHKDLVSVEATPQHLTLAAPDCYERLGTLAQMNPPIRNARHREGLWRAVNAGIVDVIGSDHAPHTLEEKAKPYPQSPSGMPGVQTLLPLLLNHVNAGQLTLQRLVDLTSAGPQRVFGLAGKGRIACGYDADFTIVDLKRCRRIEENWLKSKCGWSPFTDMAVTGWPIMTIVRGYLVMREGELFEPIGQPIKFQETILPS